MYCTVLYCTVSNSHSVLHCTVLSVTHIVYSTLDYFYAVFTFTFVIKEPQESTTVGTSRNTGRPPRKVHKWYTAPWQGCFPFFFCRGRERTVIGNGPLWANSLGSGTDRHWRHQQVGSWTQLRTFMCKSATVIESDTALSLERSFSRGRAPSVALRSLKEQIAPILRVLLRAYVQTEDLDACRLY